MQIQSLSNSVKRTLFRESHLIWFLLLLYFWSICYCWFWIWDSLTFHSMLIQSKLCIILHQLVKYNWSADIEHGKYFVLWIVPMILNLNACPNILTSKCWREIPIAAIYIYAKERRHMDRCATGKKTHTHPRQNTLKIRKV